MMGLRIAFAAIVLAYMVVPLASSEPPPPPDKSKSAVEDHYEGTLKHPVYAIGGETTGTVLKTEKGFFELDLSGNKEMIESAQSLNNKRVMVTGKLTTVEGKEVPERHIILVSTLAESPLKTFQGTLTCSKCALSETKDCGNALVVKDGDKKTTYYLQDKGGKENYHRNICATDVEVKVTGKVVEKDGKKTIEDPRIEIKK